MKEQSIVPLDMLLTAFVFGVLTVYIPSQNPGESEASEHHLKCEEAFIQEPRILTLPRERENLTGEIEMCQTCFDHFDPTQRTLF